MISKHAGLFPKSLKPAPCFLWQSWLAAAYRFYSSFVLCLKTELCRSHTWQGKSLCNYKAGILSCLSLNFKLQDPVMLNPDTAFTYIFTLFNISRKTTITKLPLLIYPSLIHLRNLDNKKRVLPAFYFKNKIKYCGGTYFTK